MKNRPDHHQSAVSIDWSDIHRRLETVQAALEPDLEYGPEEKKKILKTRARLLAREEAPPVQNDGLEVVEFLLAYEHYGLETSCICEVYPLKELTPLPCTPPFVLGLINVRGRIVSVIDLKKFFDLPERGLTDLNKVIIVRNGEVELGILADAMLGARTVPLSGILPPLPTMTGIRGDYLRGVTPDRMVILDVGKILGDSEITVNEEIEN